MSDTPENHNQSPLHDPHKEPFSFDATVEELTSLAGLPDTFRRKFTDERRRNSRIGRDAIKTILAQQEAIRKAEIDPVTGLPNRNVFNRELNLIVNRYNQEPNPEITLLICDLRGLKRVNDKLGHARGDLYLHDTVVAIRNSLRPEDRLYRIGGDEIGALLIGTAPDDGVVEMLAARTSQAVSDYLILPPELYTGLNVGGHMLQQGETFEELFEAADASLGVAKNAFNATIPQAILDQDPRRI